ncbi:MAG: tyrosine--tRNA ligase [Spirochaetales bacterium]|nr:tyrosine--tRNA ligase [Spirochaetales bacterium]
MGAKKKEPDIDLLCRGCVDVISREDLSLRLKESARSKKPLRIKAGFDPTAPDLHLGHTVLLRKLKHFQDQGHHVLFLIGDYTGLIGDPTGRSATRKRMTLEEVASNAITYKDQVFKILDPEKTEIVFNSTWLEKLSFQDMLELTAHYTVARMIERDDFAKRLKNGDPVGMIELMYPLIQGYDSVALKADVELGGTDQKFNLLVGRDLQREYGQPPQVVMTVPLLVGLDGSRKMSKSFGNTVGVNDGAYDMFARIMSIPDNLLKDYYLLLTDLSADLCAEKIAADPFASKKELAARIVEDYHPPGSGGAAKEQWEKEKSAAGRTVMVLPPDTPVHTITAVMPCQLPLVQLLVEAGIEKSNSAVRRLIESKSVKIGEDLTTVENVQHTLDFPGEYQLRVGKKKYIILKG